MKYEEIKYKEKKIKVFSYNDVVDYFNGTLSLSQLMERGFEVSTKEKT